MSDSGLNQISREKLLDDLIQVQKDITDNAASAKSATWLSELKILDTLVKIKAKLVQSRVKQVKLF